MVKVISVLGLSALLLVSTFSYGQLAELQRPVLVTKATSAGVETSDCPDSTQERVNIEVKQNNDRYEVKIEQQSSGGDKQRWRFSGTLEEVRQRLDASVPDAVRERVLQRLPS